MDLIKTYTFIALWSLYKNKQVHNWTIHWQTQKYYKWKDWKITWLLAWLALLFFCRCTLNSAHSSSIIALFLLNLDIGLFLREWYDFLIDKILYPGFEHTSILGRMPYIVGVKHTRNIRIILLAIWVNNKWYSFRHNKSMVDKVR